MKITNFTICGPDGVPSYRDDGMPGWQEDTSLQPSDSFTHIEISLGVNENGQIVATGTVKKRIV